MNTKMVDVTIHIDEETSSAEKESLRDRLLEHDGVMAADYNRNKPHLMIVEYNPDVIDSSEFLNVVKKLNLHGELIGM
ncbi:MAG: ATP-binding protein [Gammaproteobacteria bacterium]